MTEKPYIRPATTSDILHFYPEGIPCTVKAWTIMWQGKIAAIAGFILAADKTTVFSKMDAATGASKRLIWQTAKEMLEVLLSANLPMLAICKKSELDSGHFLKRLGFYCINEQDGLEFYRWPTR